MAQKRQSTSWMVLIFSSSFFFSGSLVTIVTSRPLSVLHTDFTWEFFHKSIPEFCSSLVQFVLIKLSKFLNTYSRNTIGYNMQNTFPLFTWVHAIALQYFAISDGQVILCDVSYSILSHYEGCFGPQGGKDACHLHCNIPSTHNDTTPVERTKLKLHAPICHKTYDNHKTDDVKSLLWKAFKFKKAITGDAQTCPCNYQQTKDFILFVYFSLLVPSDVWIKCYNFPHLQKLLFYKASVVW